LHPVSFFKALFKSFKALSMFVPPDFVTARHEMFEGFRQTMAIGLAATFIGLLIGVPYALLVARTTTPHWLIGNITRFVQVFVRSVPDLVVVLFFISAVGLGPLPGAVALSIGTFGLVSKLLGDALEGLAVGPLEGVRATGATRRQEIAGSVVPQMVPAVIGTGLYALDVSIRSSAVLGVVGAGGIGRVLDESAAMLMYETVAAVIIVLFIVIFALEQLSGVIRKQLI
jgi:phosphonate transport system permease protein